MSTQLVLHRRAERPVDISWVLHKPPAPRGIYIPRLLSIIRHLFFSLLHQTPRFGCRKILISVLMTWQRAIEIEIWRQRGGGGEQRWRERQKVQKITRTMYFCPCLRVSELLIILRIVQLAELTATDLTPGMFFSHVEWLCVATDKIYGGQIWCVSTPPESLLSNAAWERGLLLDVSSDVLLTNLSICNSWRRSYHRSDERMVNHKRKAGKTAPFIVSKHWAGKHIITQLMLVVKGCWLFLTTVEENMSLSEDVVPYSPGPDYLKKIHLLWDQTVSHLLLLQQQGQQDVTRVAFR